MKPGRRLGLFCGPVALTTLLICLNACSLAPAQRFDRQAADLGMSRQLVAGLGFDHVLYRPAAPRSGAYLHVYLEGDGLPWLRPDRISADPTPRRQLMLRLMALDPAPSLYLGRPCYHGLATQPPCHADLWTRGRYSPAVVDSMAQVLRSQLDEGDYQGVLLFGHSGGGTLAMLLAERFPQTRAVVTLAGNLDPDRWTALHRYSPLTASLNPARRLPLAADIYQLHLAGGRDEKVPPALIAAALAGQPQAEFRVLETFDHSCCWDEIWPGILERLDRRMADRRQAGDSSIGSLARDRLGK